MFYSVANRATGKPGNGKREREFAQKAALGEKTLDSWLSSQIEPKFSIALACETEQAMITRRLVHIVIVYICIVKRLLISLKLKDVISSGPLFWEQKIFYPNK